MWIHILINAKDHFKSEIKIPLEGGLLPSTQKLKKMMFSCFRTLDHHFDCCMMTFWRARFELDTGCVSFLASKCKTQNKPPCVITPKHVLLRFSQVATSQSGVIQGIFADPFLKNRGKSSCSPSPFSKTSKIV